MSYGILSFGAYIPRLRLARKSIADANSWFNPALKSQAKGERAICNWDEDPVTMAVEAGRDALKGRSRASVKSLRFASTTFPFLDRLNASLVAEALNLGEEIGSQDVSGTQRAATTALLQALQGREDVLIVGAEKREAKPAGPVEMSSGDGAAALLIGEGDPIALLLGAATRSADFVDHFRSADSDGDYGWEERWIRDAGYARIVPPVIKRCLEQAGKSAAEVTHFCMPAVLPKLANAMAKAAGIADAAVRDNLHSVCGETGTAHPLLMLAAAFEEAKPGDLILVVGFGQGADALLFQVTPALPKLPARLGVKGHLARRQPETNYTKFLAFNDNMELDRGKRAEVDKETPLSSLWRNRAALTSFMGGECKRCGTLQFPISRICVNPNCNAIDSQQPHAFADKIGRINSYTADRLTYSPDPPACYGMIQFDEGGRWMMDFTDIDANALAVGQSMQMMFRIKDIDQQRGFRRYFWKAAPTAAAQGS
ncbi:3-oxoacyl-[acyl-carrier-protein] synthase III C-terminal domain-containing protein [Ferrovibrio sp. MS7]|uniref:3-oxoacyl-[acyl-carrier-protein] synthase III C-terminal domain-containing protein n=1 Tax=Ferrovibrio TaxID=1231242 RepID=UPI0031352F5F